MAYVCLGRSKKLKDIYISRQLDIDGIHCLPDALAETKRLQHIFDENLLKEKEKRNLFWKICYLNISSLRNKQEDVSNDNYLLDSDIFSLGETHLIPGETVHFPEYTGHYASSGRWRGTVAYSRMNLCAQPSTVITENYTAILTKTNEFDIIFLYLSKNFDQDSFFTQIDSWVDNAKPMAVVGDVNWDFSNNTAMKKFMRERGFSQLIQKPTYDDGTLIDHTYVNQVMNEMGTIAEQEAAYYSDHDIVTLLIAKK